MATQLIDVSGTIKWAKLGMENMDTKFNPRFTMNMYLDAASKAILKASGSRIKPHEDEEGIYFTLSRDYIRKWKDKKTGEDHEENDVPPTVGTELDEEGNLIQMEDVRLIGNGSEGKARLAVYDSAFGKGTRLEAVHITKLVEYDATAPKGPRSYKF